MAKLKSALTVPEKNVIVVDNRIFDEMVEILKQPKEPNESLGVLLSRPKRWCN